MNQRAGRFLCLLGCVASAACGAISAAEPVMDQQWDPVELQQAFGRAKDLKLVTSVADIPADGQDKVAHVTSYGTLLSGATKPLADIGMDWSSSDALIPGLPVGQHRFTAVSDELLAILFVTGGFEVEYRLILAPRNSRTFCLFRIPALHPSDLRLAVVQEFIRPDRDQTLSKTPNCQLTLLD